jgi:hypothetical protein
MMPVSMDAVMHRSVRPSTVQGDYL